MATPVAAAEVKEPTPRRVPQRVLPGFGLTLGYTMVYLSLIVLIPLSAVFIRSLGLGWGHFWDVVTAPRVIASLRLSFGASLTAALINVIFGLIVAWVLVRYTFPFKRLIDAIVDLPFALPTAVAGIALTALYAPNGWLGMWLKPLGINVAFTPLGIVVALTFIGLPFVVRTLQPVLEDLDREVEQAAATLGASAVQAFVRVILPALWPALLTGFALAFARAVGEYGSVIFIAGNMTRAKACSAEAPSVAAACSTSRSRSSSTGCRVLTTNGKPMNVSATTMPKGVNATLIPNDLSQIPSQPLGAYSAVNAMPATAVGSANGRSTMASTSRLNGKE